jgi:hypothetical protein
MSRMSRELIARPETVDAREIQDVDSGMQDSRRICDCDTDRGMRDVHDEEVYGRLEGSRMALAILG